MDNRRDFLKKLGLAGVVVTSVAAISPDIGDPAPTLKPTIPTPENPTLGPGAGMPSLKPAFEFPTVKAGDVIEQPLGTLDALSKMGEKSLDLRTRNYPDQMVLSKSGFEAFKQQQLRHNLDPYNWHRVFDLKWHEFTDKAAYDCKEGYFEARVRPEFRNIMEGDIYRVNVLVSNRVFIQFKGDAQRMVEDQTDRAYDKIVREMKDLIRAARMPKPLEGKMKVDLASNSHTSPRHGIGHMHGIREALAD